MIQVAVEDGIAAALPNAAFALQSDHSRHSIRPIDPVCNPGLFRIFNIAFFEGGDDAVVFADSNM
jgi:hypothetical protein